MRIGTDTLLIQITKSVIFAKKNFLYIYSENILTI